ncbi:DUF2085 domain-containing protein [bacterium]|nr:DUF2085 domain-containing protein [bacterium]
MEQHSLPADNRTLHALQLLVAGINGLILLPPILMELGAQKLARYLYFILGVVCHQRADRSFYLFGENFMYAKSVIHQKVPLDQVFTFNFQDRFTCGAGLGCRLGVCTRCTGMYLGLLLGLIASELLLKMKMPKIIPILFLIPLALDGTIQTIAYILAPEHGFYESTNSRRFITGLFFGFGVGYFVVSAIRPEIAKK